MIRLSRGFTITELMFAMTFLSVLLIIIIGSVIEITRTYNKGITMKRVNQSGRTIGEELTRAVQQTQPTSIMYDNSKGRLCLGNYSFIWSIKPVNPDAPHAVDIDNRYDSGKPVLFAKVSDSGSNYCKNPSSNIPEDDAKELLGDGLAVHSPTEFWTTVSDRLSNNSADLISAKYTIGTSDNDLIDDASGRCKGGSDTDFCALNEFNVTVYAKGN